MLSNLDKERISEFTHELLNVIDDPEREGIIETPKRVAKMWDEFLSPEPFEFTTFRNESKGDDMIIEAGIDFYSVCEHHLLPFFGTATVAYIPNDGIIVGISKLARCVDFYSRRLQNQERITRQIANRLKEELMPKGVAVVLKARHLCQEMRGIKKTGAETITSCMKGVFEHDMNARNEFLKLAKI